MHKGKLVHAPLDEFHIPHDFAKQVHGLALLVIGFEVDPNAMTFTMPPDRKLAPIGGVEELVAERQQKARAFWSWVAGLAGV